MSDPKRKCGGWTGVDDIGRWGGNAGRTVVCSPHTSDTSSPQSLVLLFLESKFQIGAIFHTLDHRNLGFLEQTSS